MGSPEGLREAGQLAESVRFIAGIVLGFLVALAVVDQDVHDDRAVEPRCELVDVDGGETFHRVIFGGDGAVDLETITCPNPYQPPTPS